ncbi:MAG: hypothetical protein L0346_25810 [Chloroflexi bacterium]|nr:hypothetical protein [Chloroflexota bacterium]
MYKAQENLRGKTISTQMALAVGFVILVVVGRVWLDAWIERRQQAVLKAVEENEKRCNSAFVPLIDGLVDVKEGDIGYMQTISGAKFLPSDTEVQFGSLLLGGPAPVSSTALRQLVSYGADAVPCLIAHLDDGRETQLTFTHNISFGGIFFANEYDYNVRTVKLPFTGVDEVQEDQVPLTRKGWQYTVTIGDLCFVALGQIVNRQFNAVRYQPTAITIINSPQHAPSLLEAVRLEWGTLTLETHKESLLNDIYRPDYSERRINALRLLAYYYPETAREIGIVK